MKFGGALVLAALTGFIGLSYEIVWFRAYSFVSQSPADAFGRLLGYYLLGIAGGSFVTLALCRPRWAGSTRALTPIAIFVLLANALGFMVVPAMAEFALRLEWADALEVVAFASAAMGATFPLLNHFGVKPDDRAGFDMSKIYMANIIGSSLGSLITGLVLFQYWTLSGIAIFLALTGCALAALVLAVAQISLPGRLLGWATFAGVAALVWLKGPSLYDRVYERLLLLDSYTEESRFAEVIENRHGVITVTQDGKVYGGGAYDGVLSVSLVDDKNGIYRAVALGAVHPAPRDVLIIGVASGSFSQALASLPGVERVTIVDINPGYLGLIEKNEGAASLLSNPKVTIEIDDARRWMRRNPSRTFDAVVQNTTWHWRAFTSGLLSKEYLELVQSRLNPGGVFHYNTTWSHAAQRTALETFPHTLRVGTYLAVSDSPIHFDPERWERALTTTTIDGRPFFDETRELDRRRLAELRRLPQTLHEEPKPFGLESRESLVASTAGFPIVTDDNMACEWKFRE